MFSRWQTQVAHRPITRQQHCTGARRRGVDDLLKCVVSMLKPGWRHRKATSQLQWLLVTARFCSPYMDPSDTYFTLPHFTYSLCCIIFLPVLFFLYTCCPDLNVHWGNNRNLQHMFLCFTHVCVFFSIIIFLFFFFLNYPKPSVLCWNGTSVCLLLLWLLSIYPSLTCGV